MFASANFGRKYKYGTSSSKAVVRQPFLKDEIFGNCYTIL